MVGSLATARGAHFTVARGEHAGRSIEEIAFDNAVEGCARETFGCLVGFHQAQHATDPEVRRVMAAVSDDELGHGAWSWELAKHLERMLPVVKRRQARELRDEALHTLANGLLEAVPAAEHAALGLPDAGQLHAMAQSLRESTVG